MFDSKFYTHNRQNVLDALPHDALVVIAGHHQMQLSADITYPFRQDSNMRYLSGVNEPQAVLVFSRAESFVIVPKRSDFTALWDGQDSLQDIMHASGVDKVIESDEGWVYLRQLLNKHQNIALLDLVRRSVLGSEPNPARAYVKRRIKSYISHSQTIIDVREIMAGLRMIKQPQEIAAMQKASDITADGYAAVREQVASLKHEYEIQSVFTAAFQKQNTDHAYEPIIASGPRSCVLHYMNNDQPISDNIILYDVAAQWGGYHSDVSRTDSHIKPFNKRQQAVYDAVLSVQKAVIDEVRVGMTFIEVDTFMRERTAEVLVDLGLSKKPSIKDTKRYLPHSSHFIGLDVHDAGDYRIPLPANTVFTLEPGIYIPEEGIGVRIEDVIHLTDDGAVNMTQAIKK